MALPNCIGWINPETHQTEFIWCRWGGEITDNGQRLMNHYDTVEKVKALIKRGNLEELQETADSSPNLGPPDNPNEPTYEIPCFLWVDGEWWWRHEYTEWESTFRVKTLIQDMKDFTANI